ncbi:MAG: hypothetical protein UY50_C0006G0025 [Parcubacteria group bacterium GW2011_GWA2_49_9]|nr:MAG: hypothetical protein UY50_C0006G0025 [Parcubacteria group bacterium GW2011_GWA2_49_9]
MSKTSKQVFITGGAGFIGQAAAKAFAKAGYRVKTFDLSSPKESIGEHVTGTIMFPEELYNAMKGSDYVVHLAAMLGVKRTETARLQCLTVNTIGTINVLDAAVKAGVKKIVFASSSEVYGEPIKTPLSETDIVFPKSVYAVSKLAGEEYMRAYKQSHDLDFSIVRFFNVYGPGQVAEFVMPNFIKAALAGMPIPINGDGTQVRSFCYVDDAARGVLLSLESKKANGEVFNIGNDAAAISLNDLAHKVLTHAGKNRKHVVYLKEHQADRLHSREIKTRTADITKARKVLKYKPSVHLDEGIKRIIKSRNIPDSKAL